MDFDASWNSELSAAASKRKTGQKTEQKKKSPKEMRKTKSKENGRVAS